MQIVLSIHFRDIKKGEEIFVNYGYGDKAIPETEWYIEQVIQYNYLIIFQLIAIIKKYIGFTTQIPRNSITKYTNVRGTFTGPLVALMVPHSKSLCNNNRIYI